MARNVTIVASCDECGEEMPDRDLKITRLALGKKEVLIDLCQSCTHDMTALLSALFEAGRKPEEATSFVCPQCGKELRTQQGLATHITRSHGKGGA